MNRLKRRIRTFGEYGCFTIGQIGSLGLFLVSCLVKMVTPPIKLGRIVNQIHFVGAKSVIVIVLAGIFTGMVVALQFYDSLARFGSLELLGSAIGLSLIRELGPVVTALMVTGRVGSAICAEIGIMRISEQIDALECMGIDPYRFLMTSKFWAGLISVPLLTVFFDIAGITGGYLVSVVLLGVGDGVFMQGLYNGIEWRDVETGVIKSLVFGLLIIWICAAKGFLLHRERNAVFGAEGVSRVTTDAVVLSSICVLFSDYLVGSIML